jgi:hypothetical protein
MKKLNISTLIIQSLIFFTTTLLYGQKLYDPPNRLWEPMKDDIYLQESATKIETEKPVQGIALLEDNCFAVIDGQVYNLKDGQPQTMSNAPVDVKRLIA